MSLSTHVLDTAAGRPAAGVRVRWEAADGTLIAAGATDSDGRITAWGEDPGPGTYRLVFDTGAYQGPEAFFPEVAVTFRLGEGHHHVPLLLSPYSYSTYRGS